MSTLGYQYVSQYLASRWKITDTCGVNNLHGMPAIFGSLLSILLTRTATPEMYNQFNSAGGNPSKSSYHEIFPRPDTGEGSGILGRGRMDPNKASQESG